MSNDNYTVEGKKNQGIGCLTIIGVIIICGLINDEAINSSFLPVGLIGGAGFFLWGTIQRWASKK